MASPEYVSLIEATVELTEDFSNNLEFIATALFANSYISPSVREEALHPMRMPRAQASKLVSVITSRINLQPEAFEGFVKLLEPARFGLSLSALKKKYSANSGKELQLPEAPPIPNAPGVSHSEQGGHLPSAATYLPVAHHGPFGTPGNYQNSQQSSQSTTEQLPTTNHHSVQTSDRMNMHDRHFPSGEPRSGLNWTPDLDKLLFYKHNNKKLRLISRVAAEWEKFGLALDIDSYVIRAIKRDHERSCEDACRDLLKKWLQGEGKEPKTWGTLALALMDVPDVESVDAMYSVLDE